MQEDNIQKDGLKQSYRALFWISLSYIAVFSLGSLMGRWYLSLLFEVAAPVLAWILSRKMLTCQAAPCDTTLGFSPRPISRSLPYLPLFVGGVVGLSLLTSFVEEKLGYVYEFPFGDNLWGALFAYAVIPALTEEFFCRYLFLRYLTPHSRGGAVLASAIFFSFLHGNFFQIPYAFFAGVFLASMAVATGSVLPGVIFHLVNNVASILLHFCSETALPQILLYLLLAGINCGVLWIVFTRKRLWANLRDIFASGGNRAVLRELFCSPLVIFLILFIGEAILSIWQK